MKNRWRNQAVMATLLAVLGAAVFWYENSYKSHKDDSSQLEKKIFDLKNKQIKTITVADGAHLFKFTCLDLDKKECKVGAQPRWDLLEPRKLGADKINVNSLLSGLNNTTASDTFDLKMDPPEKQKSLLEQEYGLGDEARKDAGFRRIEVEFDDGHSIAAYFGSTHPVGDKMFTIAGKKGEPEKTKVLLVPSYFKSNFDHDLNYWRDKKLMNITSAEIISFEIASNESKLKAEKKDNTWTLNASVDGKMQSYTGDIENVDNTLRSIVFLSAKGFESEDKGSPEAKKSLMGTKKSVTITLRTEKETITLELFEASKKSKDGKEILERLLAKVSGLSPLASLETAAKSRVNRSLKDLRMTRLITSVERFTLKSVQIKGKPLGDPPINLVNKAGKWLVKENETFVIPQEKIQKFLDHLSGKNILEFVSGSQYPTGEETGITVSVWDEKPEPKRSFVFWEGDEKVYARDLLSTRKEAYLLNASVKADLPWTRDFLKPSEAKPLAKEPPLKKGPKMGVQHGSENPLDALSNEHGHDEDEGEH